MLNTKAPDNVQNVDGLLDGSVRSKQPNLNHSEPYNAQAEVEEEDTKLISGCKCGT